VLYVVCGPAVLRDLSLKSYVFDVVFTCRLTCHLSFVKSFNLSLCCVYLQTGDSSHILTGPKESLYSHYLCFVAEKARLENRVIDLSIESNVL